MKHLLVVLAVLGAACADTSKWLEFRVKYSPTAIGAGTSSFWKIPVTARDAIDEGYGLVSTTNTLGAFTFCYKKEHRVCPLYDRQGTIAGMMLAIPPSDVEDQGIPYDFNEHPVFEKKLINGVEYWTSTYYIVDPTVVAGSGRPNNVQKIGEGLWLKSGRNFTRIPTDLASIKNSTVYTWQNCIPNMGIHYYNNMTPTLKCEDAEPYFLLVKDDNIVGLGWQFSGKTKPVERDYYDVISSQAVMATVPLGPKCLAEWTDKYGVISIHMYFVKDPWTITCDQSVDSVVPIQ